MACLLEAQAGCSGLVANISEHRRHGRCLGLAAAGWVVLHGGCTQSCRDHDPSVARLPWPIMVNWFDVLLLSGLATPSAVVDGSRVWAAGMLLRAVMAHWTSDQPCLVA